MSDHDDQMDTLRYAAVHIYFGRLETKKILDRMGIVVELINPATPARIPYAVLTTALLVLVLLIGG